MSEQIKTLDEQILELEIQLAGKRMERAMATGKRVLAEEFKQLMYALIDQRKAAFVKKAEQAGGCFFAAAGEADAAAIKARGN